MPNLQLWLRRLVNAFFPSHSIPSNLPTQRLVGTLAATGLFALGLASCAAHAGETDSQILPTGMRITPLAAKGTRLLPLNPGLTKLPDFVASMGVTSRISPDGKTLLVVTAGYNQNYDANGNTMPGASNEYVFVYDISSGTPRQTQALKISVSAFEGLEWNPDGQAFYVSGGPDDVVHVFRRKQSRWIERKQISLGHNGLGLGLYGITPITAGLGVTGDGKFLLAANFQNDSVSVVDLASGLVVKEFDLRPGKIDPADAGKQGGSYPYAIAVAGNKRAYVTSQRDREVVVLDIGALPAVSVVARIHLAGQPNKALLNHAGSRLFVALDNADAIAMIDTKSNRILRNLQTIAPKELFANREELRGASPNNLAISADDRTLYVTNSGTNSVAVIALRDRGSSADHEPSGERLAGLIPTAWYPTAVSVSRDQSMLYVVNGKSLPGGNPKACIDKAYVHGNSAKCTSENQYIYQIMQSSLATIPMPAGKELDRLTRQVARNNKFTRSDHALSERSSDDELME